VDALRNRDRILSPDSLDDVTEDVVGEVGEDSLEEVEGDSVGQGEESSEVEFGRRLGGVRRGLGREKGLRFCSGAQIEFLRFFILEHKIRWSLFANHVCPLLAGIYGSDFNHA
jgi:hypothetical protein